MVKTFSKVLVGSTALALIVAGCGNNSDSATSTSSAAPAGTAAATTAPKKDVTFSVIYATGDPATKQAVVDSIAAYTKANPNVKIKDLSETTTAAYLDF